MKLIACWQIPSSRLPAASIVSHFEPNYFDNKNILDEAHPIIPHLLFARTAVGRQRQECKAKFTKRYGEPSGFADGLT